MGRTPAQWESYLQRGYNVREFGAKGDGVTDDTAAIILCLATAAADFAAQGAGSFFSLGSLKIYFPPGIYIVSSTIEILFRCVFYGDSSSTTAIYANPIASGGFTGTQMIRNWTAADWTVGETDHRKAPQKMSGPRSLYPRFQGLEFRMNDATNMSLLAWAGTNETCYFRDLVFVGVFTGSNTGINSGNWGLDLQDTQPSSGAGHNAAIAEGVIDHVHFYGGQWERQFSVDSSNVIGSPPDQVSQDMWMTNCSVGFDPTGVFHSSLYLNTIQGVDLKNCMWEASAQVGANAVIYGENVWGVTAQGGNWDFHVQKPFPCDFAKINIATGLGQNRSGLACRDVTLVTGGAPGPYFSPGFAMIRDNYHVISNDSGTYGNAQATQSNPMGLLRSIDEGIIDVRLANGAIGRLDTTGGAIPGLTDILLNRRYLSCPGVGGTQGYTSPDAADLDFTTGCDLRALILPTSWATGTTQELVWKLGGTQSSYGLSISSTGRLFFQYSKTGSALLSLTSTVAASGTVPIWVRVVVDAAGGGVTTGTFYTSLDGTVWSTLGTPVTSTVGPFFVGTAIVEVAQHNSQGHFGGNFYRGEYRNLAGTLVAYFDATSLASQATFTDSGSHAWSPALTSVTSPEEVLGLDKLPSGYVLPAIQPDIPDTSGVTLAVLEAEVNKVKDALRAAGVI